MNSAVFSNSFAFNEIRLSRYSHTDNRNGAPFHYIAYMREGTARIVSNEFSIDVVPGCFFYIPNGLSYQSYWHGDPTILFDSYGFKFFPHADDLIYPLQIIPTPKGATPLLNALASNMHDGCNSIGLFYQLLGCLLPSMTVLSQDKKVIVVNAAEQYLYEHTNVVASDLARHCGVSESGLYAAFRSVRGCTPNESRHRILAERAVRLLTTTSLTVEEISAQLGFSSSIYFRKILRDQTGKTPRMIRKERLI